MSLLLSPWGKENREIGEIREDNVPLIPDLPVLHLKLGRSYCRSDV
jgi:hypothetical protein